MVLVPPSIRSLKDPRRYEWINDEKIATAPQWLLDLVIEKTVERKVGEPQAPLDKLSAAMEVISNDRLVMEWDVTDYKTGEVNIRKGWDGWNTIFMALWRATGGSDEGFAIGLPWCCKNPHYDNEASKKYAKYSWYTRYVGNPPTSIGARTLFALAETEQPGFESVWNYEHGIDTDDEPPDDGDAAAPENEESDAAESNPETPASTPPLVDEKTAARNADIVEQMNKRHAAVSVMGKYRVMTWLPHYHIKDRAYFVAILNQMANGGRAALLDMLLKRDIANFNPEAIPVTAEMLHQKIASAPAGDRVIIGFAQDGCLPGALIDMGGYKKDRPHIARGNGPGCLFEEMRRRGGREMQFLDAVHLTDILKQWGFVRKALGDQSGWEAVPLRDLRTMLEKKYPGLKWDSNITEWGAITPEERAEQDRSNPYSNVTYPGRRWG
jgi:hypothetical protein